VSKVVIILGTGALLAFAALAVILGWLFWHNLQSENALLLQLRVERRELVGSQSAACRVIYQNGGVAGLKSYLDGRSANERNTSFAEVFAPDKSVVLLQEPTSSNHAQVPSPLGDASAPETLNLPSDQKGKWVIARVVLPDGNVLFFGRVYDVSPRGA
jgi:hypothetical protein